MIITFYKYNENTTPKVELVGFIDNFSSSYFERYYTGIGQFQIVIETDNKNIIEVIQESDFVEINGNAGVIDSVNYSKGDKFEIQVNGYELKELIARRIVEPKEGYTHIKINGSPESVIAGIIETQLINPEQVNRTIDGVIDSYAESAETVNYEGRFSNCAEDIQSIAEAYNIGWYAYIKNNRIHWKIYQGLDRKSGQLVNEPFVVSYNRDSLESSTLTYALTGTNSALVAGQGEGTDREVIKIGTESGLKRCEVYIDARDCATLSDMEQRGKEKLAGYGDNIVYDAILSDSIKAHYKDQFDLGDVGTLEDDLIGSIDFRITQLTEVYESDYMALTTTLGYDKKSLLNKLQQINSNNKAIASIEAPGGTDYIVNQGTKDGWYYRTWSSGKKEAWYSQSFSGTTSARFSSRGTTANDTRYLHALSITGVSIPAGIGFTTVPHIQKTMECVNNGWLVSDGESTVSNTSGSVAYFWRVNNTPVNVSGKILYYIFGG